jgi:hypothetical protein
MIKWIILIGGLLFYLLADINNESGTVQMIFKERENKKRAVHSRKK